MNQSDGNLLFGILALQNYFIDQDQLVAGLQAWMTQRSKPLGEVLCDLEMLSDEAHQLLKALVEVHLKEHEQDAAKSLAALSSIGSAKQELSKIVDEDLQLSLAHVSANRVEDPYATVPSAIETPTSQGRFRVLRLHAKGGLGQVSVARDEEVGREVALKEIQFPYADDTHSRQRFVFEAEVTGGLEHPGIVPVYGLGHYANGRPYYAMRFVRGDSLKEAINAFHQSTSSDKWNSELRSLLGRFVDVCNAIAYAHSRGVLHRDLKPGNIMLGKYGETLVVDWGLAKVKASSPSDGTDERPEQTIQPLSGSELDPTRVGSMMGTPAYMSPEQAEGRVDELGPASDVYSLGATLYCLLTGKPPHQGSSRSSLVKRISAGIHMRPRGVVPQIPKALEAICLKALQLEPGDRYESATALADDVERWMADKSVIAHGESAYEHATRLSRKHSAVVVTSGISLALLVLVSTTAAFWINAQRKSNAELARKERSARLAEVASRQAERDTVHEFTTLVANDELLDQPGMLDLRQRLLQKSQDYYESARNLDYRSTLDLARSRFNIAMVQDKLSSGDAYVSFLAALEVLEQNFEAEPEDRESGLLLVRTLRRLSSIERDREDKSISAAFERANRAREVASVLLSDHPSDREVLLVAASAETGLARMYRVSENPDRLRLADQHFADAEGIIDRIGADPLDREILLTRSLIACGRAQVSDYAPAVAMLKRIASDLEAAEEDLATKLELISVLSRLGNVHWHNKQFEPARQTLIDAVERLEPWAYVNPEDHQIQLQLANLYDFAGYTSHQAWLGRSKADPQELDSAVAFYEKGRVIYERFGDGMNNEQLLMWNNIYNGLGLVERDRERYAESEDWYRKALELLGTRSDTDPRPAILRRQTLANLAKTISRQGEYQRALKNLDQAAAIAKRFSDEVENFAPTMLARADCQLALYLKTQDKMMLASAIEDCEYVRKQTEHFDTYLARFYYVDALLKIARFSLLADDYPNVKLIAAELQDLQEPRSMTRSEVELSQSITVGLAEIFAMSASDTHAKKQEIVEERVSRMLGFLVTLQSDGFFDVDSNRQYLDENRFVNAEMSEFDIRRVRYSYGGFAYIGVNASEDFQTLIEQLDQN